MAKRDYYEVLGIDRDADETAIKKAYRSLAMQYHPDRNPGDAQAVERMKEVNEAYAVLSDEHKRRLYDTYGHAGLEGYTQEDIFRGVDFAGLFREFGLGDVFGFGGGLFDSFFGRRPPSRAGSSRGADLRYDLALTLEEAAFGAETSIELPEREVCSKCDGSGAREGGLEQCDACDGSGQIVREQRSGSSIFRQITVCGKCRGRGQLIKEACDQCQGTGILEKTREVAVQIPAGAETGHSIRLEGEGEKGEGLPGDLYVVLHVERHPTFERHGDDIFVQQDISLTTAALGGQVEAPTLDGTATVDVPEATQTGTAFRIMGQGVPRLDGQGRGDQYVIVRVLTPTDLSDEERELLRQFERLRQGSQAQSSVPNDDGRDTVARDGEH